MTPNNAPASILYKNELKMIRKFKFSLLFICLLSCLLATSLLSGCGRSQKKKQAIADNFYKQDAERKKRQATEKEQRVLKPEKNQEEQNTLEKQDEERKASENTAEAAEKSEKAENDALYKALDDL